MQLGGPPGNVRLNREDPSSVEAVRRWNAGCRIANVEEFERTVVDGVILVAPRGIAGKARGMDLELDPDGCDRMTCSEVLSVTEE